jgi:hypothetical protein
MTVTASRILSLGAQLVKVWMGLAADLWNTADVCGRRKPAERE